MIQQRDEGTKERPYPHAIVAGIERYVYTSNWLSAKYMIGAEQTARMGWWKDRLQVRRQERRQGMIMESD